MRKVLFLTALLLVGCSKQDTEGLSTIGRKLLERADARTASLREKVAKSMPSGPVSPSLETRVGQRLRNDKALADTTITVRADGNKVELKGALTDEQRKRAVELAETTQGVESVSDLLDVSQ